MRKVRVYYKGRYYYLGKAKNLEEELNLKRDFLRQVVNIPVDWDKIKDGSSAGFFLLFSGVGVGNAAAGVDTHLRFISEDAAEYAAKTFKPLYMKHIFGID